MHIDKLILHYETTTVSITGDAYNSLRVARYIEQRSGTFDAYERRREKDPVNGTELSILEIRLSRSEQSNQFLTRLLGLFWFGADKQRIEELFSA